MMVMMVMMSVVLMVTMMMMMMIVIMLTMLVMTMMMTMMMMTMTMTMMMMMIKEETLGMVSQWVSHRMTGLLARLETMTVRKVMVHRLRQPWILSVTTARQISHRAQLGMA